ncbi:MAG TPA: BrnT family toxin [Candidatus Acidoferrum sp.]|nr:BrnT family toxin [Candidatus Acidoferrum sp.]
MWYNCYTGLRLHFDEEKSRKLRANRKRAVGFEEASELFCQPHYIDPRSDDPEQYRAVGWVAGKLYTVIFEIRNDDLGEYYHLVTLWKATREDRKIYEANC